MEYRLEAKPFEYRNGRKYKIIEITDITFHTSAKKATESIGKKIRKSFVSKQPGRIFSPITDNGIPMERAFIIDALKKDPEFLKFVQEEESKGFKVLIGFPKVGVPALIGKDTQEFMNSIKGKRIIRRLMKDKN